MKHTFPAAAFNMKGLFDQYTTSPKEICISRTLSFSRLFQNMTHDDPSDSLLIELDWLRGLLGRSEPCRRLRRTFFSGSSKFSGSSAWVSTFILISAIMFCFGGDIWGWDMVWRSSVEPFRESSRDSSIVQIFLNTFSNRSEPRKWIGKRTDLPLKTISI